MSFWWLEGERRDKAERTLAAALGIDFEDLSRLDWSVVDWSSTDGVFLGFVVTFGPGADLTVLANSNASLDDRSFILGPDFETDVPHV